ncbi:MAG: hypothetical protein CMF67_04980 [Magnetovibrio sp.]|nr:hypothetical protein [Magnetovibrio sp.]
MARNNACDIRNVATEVEPNFEAAKVHPAGGRSTAGDLTAQALACFLFRLMIQPSRSVERMKICGCPCLLRGPHAAS